MAEFKGSPVDPVGQRINNNGVGGDFTVVAAVAGKSHRIYGIRISVAGAVIVQIKDGAGTVLEVLNFAAAGGAAFFDLRFYPYYTTTAGNAFVINASAAVQVDGRVEYTTA